MSKQSDAKAAQGYVAKAVPSTCGNCAHYASDMALSPYFAKRAAKGEKDWDGSEYTVERYGVEKNRRCTLGGFAVGKTATCSQYLSPTDAA